jgi:prevent-host-death family protein
LVSENYGSRSATVVLVTTIPQKELRNSVGEVLRRAEAGERFTITVAGRPVAELGPTARRSWVGGPALETVFATPVPRTLPEDLERFPGALVDPFT